MLLDASVTFVSEDIDPVVWRAYGTIDVGEAVGSLN